MWSRVDNQEVGLEAAILERVRNSSLVKWFCADNVAGLSTPPKLRRLHVEPCFYSCGGGGAGVRVGRGASCHQGSRGVIQWWR
jgi:hypothetical protein